MAGWHPQDIMAALKKRGTPLARLGREQGFSRSTLHSALTRRWPAAHLAISRALGVSRHDIWPDWYAEDDTPRHRSRDPQLARRIAAAVSKARKAA